MNNKQVACGLLMCRWLNTTLQYFLVHPGGPFFKNKNEGVWSIPKGLPEQNEDHLTTAIREFTEETGIVPNPPFYELKTVQQKSGKLVYAWTFEGTWQEEQGITSNMFSLEWPPKSGKMQQFPEQDRGAWMDITLAKKSINPGQIPLLEHALIIHQQKTVKRTQ